MSALHFDQEDKCVQIFYQLKKYIFIIIKIDEKGLTFAMNCVAPSIEFDKNLFSTQHLEMRATFL